MGRINDLWGALQETNSIGKYGLVLITRRLNPRAGQVGYYFKDEDMLAYVVFLDAQVLCYDYGDLHTLPYNDYYGPMFEQVYKDGAFYAK